MSGAGTKPDEVTKGVDDSLAAPIDKLVAKAKELISALESGGMNPDDKDKLIAELKALVAAYEAGFDKLANRLQQDDAKAILDYKIGGPKTPPAGGSSTPPAASATPPDHAS